MSGRRTWASIEGLYLTKSWRQLRALHMSENPFCVMCDSMMKINPATTCDHIIPITKENWTDLFLDPDNLQSLCDECHQFKTNRDKIKRDGLSGNNLMNEILNE